MFSWGLIQSQKLMLRPKDRVSIVGCMRPRPDLLERVKDRQQGRIP